MAQTVRKYIERAVRYTLNPSDRKKLKFAIEGDKSRIFTTSLVNISLSGLAFVTDSGSTPKLNTLIKLEFSIPGGEQIAWWGRVVRIETYHTGKWSPSSSENFVPKEKLVAVSFEQLPEKMKTEIHKGVAVRIQKQNQKELWKNYLNKTHFVFSGVEKIFIEHSRKVLFFALCTLFTMALLYFLSRPSGNYTPDRGAPWGQRFK